MNKIGIDVSVHNGRLNWSVLKEQIDFAIIRVGFRGYGSSGTLCSDQYAEQNIKNAKAAGLKVGVYFFSQEGNRHTSPSIYQIIYLFLAIVHYFTCVRV